LKRKEVAQFFNSGWLTFLLTFTAHYAWQKYCQKVEIQATIHQLRHSRASQLLQAGVPVTTVRKQLGHRNIQSTLLYAEVVVNAFPCEQILPSDMSICPPM